MEKTIKTIEKNSREVIQVALTDFEAKDGTVHQMVSARVYYDDGAGGFKPGRNGLNCKLELLPAIIEGLQAAEVEARAAGLLTDADPEGQDEAA